MNQILISKRFYETKQTKRKRRFYKTMYTLSIITIVVLLVYYVYAEKNRNEGEAVGQELLSQVEDDNTVVEESAIVFALDDNQEEDPEEEAEEEIIPEHNDNGPVESKVKTKSGNQYEIESVLSYPKLGINYSVLSSESEALLKISLCKYWGPSPNKVGNYCIVGHNYRSGKMFGKLSMAQNGDQVILKDLSGNQVTYSVYTKYVVEPTDVSCTSQLTNGKRELSLITCTNYGKQRLVVKAREV